MRFFRRRKGVQGSSRLSGHGTTDPYGAATDPRTPLTPALAPEDPHTAAREFWRGWTELLPEVSAALGNGQPQRVENSLCELVAGLHPDLQFSLEHGERAVYALVLSGQEDPALRPYTDAWISLAPAEDAMWEYHDSVPPVPDPDQVTVNIGEYRIALADVRVSAQVDRAADAVDVAVYHPLLGELDQSRADAMTFLPLDATLGERMAATWLGRVEMTSSLPEGAITLVRLRELVHELAEDDRYRHDRHRGDEDVGAAD